MTMEEALRVLGEVTYKPGYKLVYEQRGEHRIELELHINKLKDADKWSLFPRLKWWNRPTVNIHFHGCVIDARNYSWPGGLLHHVVDFLDRWERHETREWFRWEGAKVFDLHKEEYDG